MFEEAARQDTGIDPKMSIAMDKLDWLQKQPVKARNLSQPSKSAGWSVRNSCPGSRLRRHAALIGRISRS
jgi:hypothetical protein